MCHLRQSSHEPIDGLRNNMLETCSMSKDVLHTRETWDTSSFDSYAKDLFVNHPLSHTWNIPLHGTSNKPHGADVWSLPPCSTEGLVRMARERRSSAISALLKDTDTPEKTNKKPKIHHKSRICSDNVRFTLAGPFSALGLPNKIEGLLKLLAQSLHLVIRVICSRKRRRDRECLPQDQEDKPYLEETVLERNSDADLAHLVELPPGIGYEEWLASHTIAFFHHVNLMYGTVCEFCTLTCCPDMAGPGMRQYLWFDEKGKKTRVAAPQYVDYVMTFTQNTVNDESIFPTKFDSEFPSSFESIVKKIHRLLFHVIAHIYHSHFREIKRLFLHTHLNCLFAHFVLFNEKFNLIDQKETDILKDLIHALKIHPEDENTPVPQDISGTPQDHVSCEVISTGPVPSEFGSISPVPTLVTTADTVMDTSP